MKKYTVKQYYEMSDVQFRKIYEEQSFKNVLDFLETRIRLEILSIIRRFQLKGEVLFEVRKKSTSSAYSKLQTELVERQAEFGSKPVYLFEILRDLIGARLICVHEEVQKRVFEYILQVESIVIQPEGLEFYSAPFRDYTLAKDIHEELLGSIQGVKKAWAINGEIEKKSKSSNYESLHFYVMFASKIDFHLLHRLTDGRRGTSEGERVRDRAEGKYLLDLYDKFSEKEKKIISTIPIECQVRTMTDHLWAQEEHKYVYKNASLPVDSLDNQRAVEVLRSTFTGLKFAYYNVDRLRSLVRNVSASNDAPVPIYTGVSENINPLRFAYFGKNVESIETKFRAAEKAFMDVNKDLVNGVLDDRSFLEVIVELYNSVIECDSKKQHTAAIPFDTESWGRRRLFHLLFAYMALSASGKRLSSSAADLLKDQVDLVEIVGEAAFRASIIDNEGLVKLASKLYERVETFDRIARSMNEQNQDLDEERRRVFFDPLVGIRLASSFFIQGEFAGAFKALRDMFEIASDDDLVAWADLELARDFSLPEILMRYSQYLFLDSFEDKERMLDNFLVLENVFTDVFEIDNEVFQADLYRTYAWYYSILNYLFAQKTLVPAGLETFKSQAKSYLIEHYNSAFASSISEKPEVLLVSIYMQIHLFEEEDRRLKVDDAYNRYLQVMRKCTNYPRIGIAHLNSMAAKIKERTREKSTRQHDITFISYSQENTELVNEVVTSLKKKSVNVLIDRDFEKGQGISKEVERAMLSASSAVLVVTPEYFNSSWAEEERAFLMDKRRRKELKLVVLKIGVEDNEVVERAPLLAGVLAYTANADNLEEVLSEIAREILGSN